MCGAQHKQNTHIINYSNTHQATSQPTDKREEKKKREFNNKRKVMFMNMALWSPSALWIWCYIFVNRIVDYYFHCYLLSVSESVRLSILGNFSVQAFNCEFCAAMVTPKMPCSTLFLAITMTDPLRWTHDRRIDNTVANAHSKCVQFILLIENKL